MQVVGKMNIMNFIGSSVKRRKYRDPFGDGVFSYIIKQLCKVHLLWKSLYFMAITCVIGCLLMSWFVLPLLIVIRIMLWWMDKLWSYAVYILGLSDQIVYYRNDVYYPIVASENYMEQNKFYKKCQYLFTKYLWKCFLSSLFNFQLFSQLLSNLFVQKVVAITYNSILRSYSFAQYNCLKLKSYVFNMRNEEILAPLTGQEIFLFSQPDLIVTGMAFVSDMKLENLKLSIINKMLHLRDSSNQINDNRKLCNGNMNLDNKDNYLLPDKENKLYDKGNKFSYKLNEYVHPKLRTCIKKVLWKYCWVRDKSFNIDRHVRNITYKEAMDIIDLSMYNTNKLGEFQCIESNNDCNKRLISSKCLNKLISILSSDVLEPEVPLWEFLLLENINGNINDQNISSDINTHENNRSKENYESICSGKCNIIIFRCHHCLADGVALMDIFINDLLDDNGVGKKVLVPPVKLFANSLFLKLLYFVAIMVRSPFYLLRLLFFLDNKTDINTSQCRLDYGSQSIATPVRFKLNDLKEIKLFYTDKKSYISATTFSKLSKYSMTFLCSQCFSRILSTIHSATYALGECSIYGIVHFWVAQIFNFISRKCFLFEYRDFIVEKSKKVKDACINFIPTSIPPRLTINDVLLSLVIGGYARYLCMEKINDEEENHITPLGVENFLSPETIKYGANDRKIEELRIKQSISGNFKEMNLSSFVSIGHKLSSIKALPFSSLSSLSLHSSTLPLSRKVFCRCSSVETNFPLNGSPTNSSIDQISIGSPYVFYRKEDEYLCKPNKSTIKKHTGKFHMNIESFGKVCFMNYVKICNVMHEYSVLWNDIRDNNNFSKKINGPYRRIIVDYLRLCKSIFLFIIFICYAWFLNLENCSKQLKLYSFITILTTLWSYIVRSSVFINFLLNGRKLCSLIQRAIYSFVNSAHVIGDCIISVPAKEEVRLIIPVNIRTISPPHSRLSLCNKFSSAFISLPLCLNSSASYRFNRVSHKLLLFKTSYALHIMNFFESLAYAVCPDIFYVISQILTRKARIIFSNVAGPDHLGTWNGCKVKKICFIVPRPKHIGIGISAMSSEGNVELSIACDECVIQDAEKLGECIQAEFHELLLICNGSKSAAS